MSPQLIMVIVGLALTVLALGQVAPSITAAITGKKMELGIGREQALVQQIIRYRALEGAYPASMADLLAKSYWSAADNDNGFGGVYSFTVDSTRGVVSVSTTLADAGQRAQYIGNYRHAYKPVDAGGGVVLTKFSLPSAGTMGAPLPAIATIPATAATPSAASNTYWYDTSGATAVLKVSDGATWVAANAANGGVDAPSAANIVASAAALPATGTQGDVRYVYDNIGNVLKKMVFDNGAWGVLGDKVVPSSTLTAGVTSLTAPVGSGQACLWNDGVMAYDSVGAPYACSDPLVNQGGLSSLSCTLLGRKTFDISGTQYQCGLSSVWQQLAGPVCATGYIPVSAYTLPSGTFVPAFCVMKYEAKKSSLIPGDRVVSGPNAAYAVSDPMGTPWVLMTWQDSKVACANVGARLIAENEWLSLAHQITSVATNWSGGAVGSGLVYVGHSDNTPGGMLEASSDDSSGYYMTGDGATSPGDAGFGPYWASNVPAAYQGQRRTLTLPNGQVIWDLAGNAAEWVDQTMPSASRYDGRLGWLSYNISEGGLPVASNLRLDMKPPGGYNANQGMGRYLEANSALGSYNNVSEAPDNCTTYCAPFAPYLRGGGVNGGPYGGIFELNLELGRSYVNGSYGFRCTQ